MAKYFMREMYDMNGVGERLVYPQIVEFGQILEDEFVRRVGEEGIGPCIGHLEQSFAIYTLLVDM
jgi:hypothetical protein